jgi:glycosyltransferase involved in cell wall biosynthesis
MVEGPRPAAAPEITVLTCTFNRADKLRRLYESICAQTFRDFEWLVVDDGSTDGTAELVRELIAESRLPIRYLFKENGGRHTAMNAGVQAAAGTMCAVIDDDDWYVPEGLERLVRHWEAIPDRTQFAEVQGLCLTADGEIVGMRYPEPVFDSDYLELTEVLAIAGDRLGMIRTDVLRRFPFPESFTASFVDERIVWNRISASYRIRGVNEVIGCKDYQATGLSSTHLGQNIALSDQRLLYYEELVGMGRRLPARSLYKAYANLIRNGLHQDRSPIAQARRAPRKSWWAAALPAGLALYWKDRRAA